MERSRKAEMERIKKEKEEKEAHLYYTTPTKAEEHLQVADTDPAKLDGYAFIDSDDEEATAEEVTSAYNRKVLATPEKYKKYLDYANILPSKRTEKQRLALIKLKNHLKKM